MVAEGRGGAEVESLRDGPVKTGILTAVIFNNATVSGDQDRAAHKLRPPVASNRHGKNINVYNKILLKDWR